MAGGWFTTTATKLSQLLQATARLSSSTPSSSTSGADIQILQHDLEYVQRTWERFKAVLSDAEQREVRDKSVRLWLCELRGLAYEADDLLDLYQYEVIAMEVRERDAASKRTGLGKRKAIDGQVRDFKPLPFPLEDPYFRQLFGDRIRRFKERYDEMCKMTEHLQLKEFQGLTLNKHIVERQPSGSLPVEAELFGRERDLSEVVNVLTSGSGQHVQVPVVVALVGMGGVGKTSLAQHAFGQCEVGNYFVIKGWVCVSDEFDLAGLTKKVFQALTKEASDVTELSVLQEKLKSHVLEQKFLLIMDDVWNEDGVLWERFLSCLRYGAEGSKLLITTRSKQVANTAQAAEMIEIGCLSKEDGWSLFQQCAFRGSTGGNSYPELTSIGRKIAKKCAGLPLALKVLGCRLSCDLENPSAWRNVLESDLWDINTWEDGKHILGPLLLSYIHLPLHLKPCLKMCSVFEKDQIIGWGYLVSLWIAHDLIAVKDKDNWMDLEETGISYIESLISRSFFQTNKHQELTMHDLIHDLVQFLSKDESSNNVCGVESAEGKTDPESAGPRSLVLIDEFRQLSLKHINFKCLRAFFCVYDWPEDDFTLRSLKCPSLLSSKHLRSLKIHHIRITKTDMEQICNLYNLRELHLIPSNFEEELQFPESVGNLKHLLRLELVGVRTKNLPKSIFRLPKLQSLYLDPLDSGPYTLPTSILDLTRLQEIYIHGECDNFLFYFPVGFGRLSNIRSLGDSFKVGRSSEHARITELGDMIHLQGSLCIWGLDNVLLSEDAKDADLTSKENLQELELNWQSEDDAIHHDENEVVQQNEQVLENLRPHPNLRMLKIMAWKGARLPSWLKGDPPYLTQLVELKFYMCKRLKSLPLGCVPRLKKLDIYDCPIDSIPIHSSSPMLKNMHLNSCRFLKSISLHKHTTLELLCVKSCPNLEIINFGSPFQIGCPLYNNSSSLIRLELCNCPLLRDVQFPTSLKYCKTEHCPLLQPPPTLRKRS